MVNADQILVLKDGQIVERGTHEQLLALAGGVYASMWNQQLEKDSAEEENETETTEGVELEAKEEDKNSREAASSPVAVVHPLPAPSSAEQQPPPPPPFSVVIPADKPKADPAELV